MPIRTNVVSVATTPTLLHRGVSGRHQQPEGVAIFNNGASTIFVGDSAVTVANGYPVAATESLSLDILEVDEIYGIVASGTVEARVLRTYQ